MMMHSLTNVQSILDCLYSGLRYEERTQCAEALDSLEDAMKKYDPVAEFWIEQLDLRGIKLTDEKQKKYILDWLEHWTDDSFDMLSDAISAAMNDCERDMKEENSDE